VAKISVDVICQRCLDPMSIEIKAAIALQVIWSEDRIANVSPDYEPWIVVDKIADLAVVLEDELLLALPIVNYHNQVNVQVMPLFQRLLLMMMRRLSLIAPLVF
jgi:uncharacterized protein